MRTEVILAHYHGFSLKKYNMALTKEKKGEILKKLKDIVKAFEMVENYKDGVIKAIIRL